jgi:hypothetical protein
MQVRSGPAEAAVGSRVMAMAMVKRSVSFSAQA